MSSYKINLDLTKLENAFVKVIQGKTQSKKCLCIPIEDNYIFEGKKGAYLHLVAFELKQPKFEDTHSIKLSLPTEKYNELSVEKRNEMPFVGGMKPLSQMQQPQTNKSVESDPFGGDFNDDFPF